jgi:hypothetical protein
MDLLGQVADAAGRDAPLGRTARAAVDALRHGVVTYSSVEDLTAEDVEDFPAEDAGHPVSGPEDLPPVDGVDLPAAEAGRGTLPA